jgi:predicted DNA-binding transcriptional regulator YafY
MAIGKLDISALIKNVKKGTEVLKQVPLTQGNFPFKTQAIDTSPDGNFYGRGPVDSCIEKAARQLNLLRFEYTDSKGNVTIRTVEPYELRDGSFFAFCLTRNEIRNFSLNGISNTEVLRDVYAPRWDVKI